MKLSEHVILFGLLFFGVANVMHPQDWMVFLVNLIVCIFILFSFGNTTIFLKKDL